MDFTWTEQQLQLKRSVMDFAERELQDDVVARDREGVFPRALWNKCAAFGLLGLPFAEEYGGQNVDILAAVLAMEGLGYSCRDNGLIFGMNAQMWSVQMPIQTFGTNEQKSGLLPRLISGEWIGGHGMSEPGSGSDAFSLSTTARRDGTAYILNGSKMFVSNGPVADVFVVFATVGKKRGFMGVTAFLVERDRPGFEVGKDIGKMGLRTCPWSEIVLENCRIPEQNRLGREGEGYRIFSDSMEWERGCLLAAAIGSMQRQLENSIRYAKERKQFGVPIGKFQAVGHKIAGMKIRLETARLILYHLAWKKSCNQRSPLDAALVKAYVSECWKQSSLDAIQIHGGYGYATEFEVEREFRDAIGSSIYSGTTEIQKNIIANYLGL
jgi:alkylation response protein AidB-like acyl-CoA dehydrogenase